MGFAENLYTFRRFDPVFVGANLPKTAQDEALAAVEAKLIEANRHAVARRYQQAISAYDYARDLIQAQIDAGHRVGSGVVAEADTRLFDSVLSASLEWLNVVSVPEPPALVRPRIASDAGLLRRASRTPQGGLADIRLRDGDGIAAPVADRRFTVVSGSESVALEWTTGAAPPAQVVKSQVYARRRTATELIELVPHYIEPGDLAIGLAHDYYYTIPLGLAECYHALGDYSKAETYYLAAVGYEFLNAAIEAPYLWLRLASLYVDWGHALYRTDSVVKARATYENLVRLDGAVPASALYTNPALAPGAAAGNLVISRLQSILDGTETVSALGVNPQIPALIIQAYQQLVKIDGGLDFWGLTPHGVPIWTFEYLQSVATNFANLAINAEREFVSFQQNADQSTLTRQQLAAALTQADAELQAVRLQAKAVELETQAFDFALSAADLRAQNAKGSAEVYETLSEEWTNLEAQIAADQRMLADTPQDPETGWDLFYTGSDPIREKTLRRARLTRDYEVMALQMKAGELSVAALQAGAELKAAHARQKAAKAGIAVAEARAAAALQDLDAFDSQFFTPDVWQRMAETMSRLVERYLAMAIHVARLMQAAYNFETDQSLQLIKSDYSSQDTKGLLGADALLADIQTFTYDLVTDQTRKTQPLRQTISLSQRYPFAFEKQLRKSGVMEFETRIEDFDECYPGTYAGRIEGIEVELDGIVPARGIYGTLTNAGVSFYRVPAAMWTDPDSSGTKTRFQPAETLVLSDYAVRQDALLIGTDSRMRRVFQGAGLASSWRLELPLALNDFDLEGLVDVRLTFYYKTRFDEKLRSKVLARLSTLAGAHERQAGIPLRWTFPDAFFHFQDTGELRIRLRRADFRRNELDPKLKNVAVVVATDGTVPADGITLQLATPGKAPATAVTDASGVITSAAPQWSALPGGSALGEYVITLPRAPNPDLVTDGVLNLAPIVNVSLLFGYSFTPRT